MLPVFPEPVPGEVLSSYVCRLALANGMRPMRLTTVLGLLTFWKRDPDVSATLEEVAVFATATGLPVERLWSCSVMPLLTRLHENPSANASPRFLVTTGKHKGPEATRGHPVCAACVRETGVVQRHWRLTTSVMCERHRRPLVDRCGYCQAPIHHVRVHLTRAHRMQVMEHRPECCSSCGEEFPIPPEADPETTDAALVVQDLMWQATELGSVTWNGMEVPARDFQFILESVLQLHYPPKAVSGVAKWRPETSSLAERWPVVVRAGRHLSLPLPRMLRAWRAEGRVPHHVLLWGAQVDGPGWFRDLVTLGLSTDARVLPPVWTGRKTFLFTERQWRILAPLVPPVPRESRKRKPARAVLQAWFTRNLKGTRQQDWTGAWSGRVSYPAMHRGIVQMMASGVLDAVVGRMLAELPECRAALTAPETVCALTRMGSVHADHLWTLMIEDRLHDLREKGVETPP